MTTLLGKDNIQIYLKGVEALIIESAELFMHLLYVLLCDAN
jgi:hypothetical protein